MRIWWVITKKLAQITAENLVRPICPYSAIEFCMTIRDPIQPIKMTCSHEFACSRKTTDLDRLEIVSKVIPLASVCNLGTESWLFSIFLSQQHCRVLLLLRQRDRNIAKPSKLFNAHNSRHETFKCNNWLIQYDRDHNFGKNSMYLQVRWRKVLIVDWIW